MKRFFTGIFFVLLMCFSAYGSNRVQPLDSLAHQSLIKLMEKYLQVFTISDMRGHYLPFYEAEMQELFAEDAVIYNFLPGTPSYREHISVTDYTEQAGDLARKVIIQPGITDYRLAHVTEIVPEKQWLVTVNINKDIVLFSKDFDKLSAFILPVKILVDVRRPPEPSMILSISNDTPGWVDLDFRVMLSENISTAGKKIGFSYRADQNKALLKRIRHTDRQGKVFLSLVPSDVLLYIDPPPGYRMNQHYERTGEEWFQTPQQDRVITLERKAVQPWHASWLKAGAGYQMKTAAHYKQLHNVSDFHQKNMLVLPRSSATFILNYAVPVRLSKRGILALGTGLEYHKTLFDIQMDQVDQIFTGQIDADEDMFDLFLDAESISETYRHESLAIPFLITYRRLTRHSWMPAIDLTTKILYHLPATYHFETSLTQTTSAYYPAYNLRLYDLPEYGYVTNTFNDKEPLIGGFDKDFTASLHMELAAGFPVANDRLWIQPVLFYKVLYSGGGESSIYPQDDSHSEAYSYRYLSSLGYRKMGLGQFGTGLHLIFFLTQ